MLMINLFVASIRYGFINAILILLFYLTSLWTESSWKLPLTWRNGLKLPKCATLSSLFHHNFLSSSILSTSISEGKALFFASFPLSSDQNIKSLKALVSDLPFIESEIPLNSVELVHSCKSLSKKKDLKCLYRDLQGVHTDKCGTYYLESLPVQKKLLDLTPLESKLHVCVVSYSHFNSSWSTIFFDPSWYWLCTNSRYTVYRWNYQCCDPLCKLCHSLLYTVYHIFLNCCPVSFSQDWYTWRHDLILRQLFNIVRSNVLSCRNISLCGLTWSQSFWFPSSNDSVTHPVDIC